MVEQLHTDHFRVIILAAASRFLHIHDFARFRVASHHTHRAHYASAFQSRLRGRGLRGDI